MVSKKVKPEMPVWAESSAVGSGQHLRSPLCLRRAFKNAVDRRPRTAHCGIERTVRQQDFLDSKDLPVPLRQKLLKDVAKPVRHPGQLSPLQRSGQTGNIRAL